ncbi:autotransporter [Bordetella pertussis STO1-CHOC-0021]|nr:autotransporter [Bordetella pertussis STO1-CHOC-0021]
MRAAYGAALLAGARTSTTACRASSARPSAVSNWAPIPPCRWPTGAGTWARWLATPTAASSSTGAARAMTTACTWALTLPTSRTAVSIWMASCGSAAFATRSRWTTPRAGACAASTAAMVSRIRHAFKVDDAKGRRVRGQYRGNGVGASLELGKRFTWPGAWYVEPQLEVAAFHAQGADYTASNGLRIKDDGTNSMLGRLGLHVGRQFDLGDGRVVQPYMKLSWVQEFDGKGTVRTNDIRHKVRLDGGRTELAVGVASQLGKHGSLFGSYEYAKGSRQTMPWTFHVGYRYAW